MTSEDPSRLILASRSPRRRQLLAEAGYRFEVIPPDDDAEGPPEPGESPQRHVARLAEAKAGDVVRRIASERPDLLDSRDRPPPNVTYFTLPRGGSDTVVAGEGCEKPSSSRDLPSPLVPRDPSGGRVKSKVMPKVTGIGPPPLVLGCDTVAECDGTILGKPRDQDHAREILLRLSGREHRVFSGVCLWPIGDSPPVVRVAETRLRMDRLSAKQLDEYLATGQWQGKAGAFGYQDRIGWVHVIEGSESNVVGLPMELLAEMLGAVK